MLSGTRMCSSSVPSTQTELFLGCWNFEEKGTTFLLDVWNHSLYYSVTSLKTESSERLQWEPHILHRNGFWRWMTMNIVIFCLLFRYTFHKKKKPDLTPKCRKHNGSTVLCFLGNLPASELLVLMFLNLLAIPSSQVLSVEVIPRIGVRGINTGNVCFRVD